MLPRKALNTLKNKLTQIEQEVRDLNSRSRLNSVPGISRSELEAAIKRRRRQLDLAIREAFLKFMATILQSYKTYQLTVTRKPDLKAIDRNLTKFFNCEGFIQSKDVQCQDFYRLLTRTQLFNDCVMNLSFTSELEPSLADAFYFFADICSRLNTAVHSPGAQTDDDFRLLELDECENSQTVVVLPPSVDNNESTSDSDEIDKSAFIYHPNLSAHCFPPIKQVARDTMSTPQLRTKSRQETSNTNENADSKSISSSTTTASNITRFNQAKLVGSTPIGVRSKAERTQALRVRRIESKRLYLGVLFIVYI